MSLANFTIDVDKLQEGRWVDIADDPDDLRLYLRSTRCSEYRKAYQRKMQKQIRVGRARKLDLDALGSIERECVSEFCLLGWDNLLDPKTNEQIPYSREFSKQLMTEDKYQLFREMVMANLNDIDAEYTDFEEDTVKN